MPHRLPPGEAYPILNGSDRRRQVLSQVLEVISPSRSNRSHPRSPGTFALTAASLLPLLQPRGLSTGMFRGPGAASESRPEIDCAVGHKPNNRAAIL
jgi:hypothetical protein